ncbi:IS3 family transposase [Geoalkalibacter halelectricus]|uniref:IS3 family transposase n=1 Tax=Geoalkalibacter halelectricus TaxID=2847045 RepID=A0ABY5ZKU0_9BACT|nr:IS3 family transposase [Geoalkalibacter halelectricus]UWZ79755.1 IS3 family transposase [Geoalkalibacter halelectricus]
MKELRSFISDSEMLSIRKQCELIDMNRSIYYYKPCAEKPENLHYMRLMDEFWLKHPTYGVLQMQDFLKGKGYSVNHKRVRRLLRKMGIMAIYPKKNLSKLGHASYIRPYLLRNLTIERPNQAWAIDITYIPMEKGFMYLTAIIDLYSRYVVGWDISNSLEATHSLEVLKKAIKTHGAPEIINSDQGSQFTSALWTNYLDNAEIKVSMDGKGRAIDNIFIERLWRTVKQDYVYLHPAQNGWELHQGLKDFFIRYNTKKTHQGIGRRIPLMVYQQCA